MKFERYGDSLTDRRSLRIADSEPTHTLLSDAAIFRAPMNFFVFLAGTALLILASILLLYKAIWNVVAMTKVLVSRYLKRQVDDLNFNSQFDILMLVAIGLLCMCLHFSATFSSFGISPWWVFAGATMAEIVSMTPFFVTAWWDSRKSSLQAPLNGGNSQSSDLGARLPKLSPESYVIAFVSSAGISFSRELPELPRTISFNEECFSALADEHEWMGFYDWLRTAENAIVGVRMTPHGNFFGLDDLAAVNAVVAKLFPPQLILVERHSVDFVEKTSDDANFGGNLIYRGDKGSMAISFFSPTQREPDDAIEAIK